MCTIFHSTESATASSTADSCFARGVVRQVYIVGFTQYFFGNYFMCIMNVSRRMSVHYVFGECAMRSIAFYSFICITLLNFTRHHFRFFSFRL
jgi:hypothetical protein